MIISSIIITFLTWHNVLAYDSDTPWKVIIKGDNSKVNSTVFWPPELQARKGDTVTWVNRDTVSHTVTSGVTNHLNYTGKIFDSRTISPGETFSFTIPSEKWSAYYYFCKIHPWMTGKIDVEDAYLHQSPISTIDTDRESYHTNEIIKIFGSVNDTYQIMPMTMQIFDEQKNPIFLNQTDLLKDHSFSYKIIANKDIFKSSGNYKIKAFYGFPSTIVDANIAINYESDEQNSRSYHIPHWVKNSATWWADSQITDSDFISSMKYLINLGYISIPSNTAKTESNAIPIWVKNDARSWTNGTISDQEFIPSIQYIVYHRVAQN